MALPSMADGFFHIFQFTEDLCAAGSTGVATCGVNGCTCTSEGIVEFLGIFGNPTKITEKVTANLRVKYMTLDITSMAVPAEIKNAQLNSWTVLPSF